MTKMTKRTTSPSSQNLIDKVTMTPSGGISIFNPFAPKLAIGSTRPKSGVTRFVHVPRTVSR
jgi:hypothetical protein